jgi:hypothetical protein
MSIETLLQNLIDAVNENTQQQRTLIGMVNSAQSKGAAPKDEKGDAAEELTKGQKAAQTRKRNAEKKAAEEAAKKAAEEGGKKEEGGIKITEVRDKLSALDRDAAKDILSRCGVKSLKEMAEAKDAQVLYAKAIRLADEAGEAEEDMLA